LSIAPGPKKTTFELSATVSTENSAAVRRALDLFIGKNGKLEALPDGFRIQAKIQGESARDLNRVLLSELRKAEKRTRLRSEWNDGKIVQKFFDYVPKGVREISK
jgi:hypothetical protein